MSDYLNKLAPPDPWAWRSDMNAPQNYLTPYMQATPAPKSVSANARPMTYDVLTALGVGHHPAQYYAGKVDQIAGFTPPGMVLDAAGLIGGPLGEGRYMDAAGNAAVMHGAGRLAHGALNALLPPLTKAARDRVTAGVMEGQPGLSAISPNKIGDELRQLIERGAARSMRDHSGDFAIRGNVLRHLVDDPSAANVNSFGIVPR